MAVPLASAPALACGEPTGTDSTGGMDGPSGEGSSGGGPSSGGSGGADMSTAADVTSADVTGDPGCERCGGETCVDLQAAEAHCGACDVACPEHATCVDGECSCGGGLMACAGACVNVQANPSHCGACDAPCDAGLVCNAGECTEGCGALTECSGGCIDTMADPLNCGACGRSCAASEACVGGRCSCGADVSYAADIEPVFVAECTNMGCHRPPALAAGLELTAGAGYAALVSVPSSQCGDRRLVEPGAPAESYLLDKLRGENLCFGSQMPKMGQSIAAADLDAVEIWICNGAPP